MIQVSKAEYRGDYKIWIEFSDGASGVADLRDFLWGPVFEPLLDQKVFQQFTITSGYRTIAWNNGADIAPEALYERAMGVKKATAHGKNQVAATAIGEATACYGIEKGKGD